jgi:hypothetical protein
LGGTEVKIVQVPLIMPDQFILAPTKDMNSKIMYKFDNGDVAELYHELCYSDKFDKDNAGTVTGDVIPDIVLRVWKNDLPDDMYLTYLFDAKYRFGKSDLPEELDKPEREDLDSMHRYRDAIYYKDKGSNKLSKEVIGSFVLYPGQGTVEELENIYKQTIERVNVGGLPLYPGLKTEDSLVKKHLAYIFNTDAVSLLNAVHSSKWDGYKEDGMNVFIPFIKGNKILQINYLENTEAPLFEYKTFLPALGLGTLRYIAPYVEGEGIKYIYEIVSHSWKARKDVYPPDHELFMNYNRKCLVLKLGNKRMLKKPLFIKGRINNHRYTKLKYINAPNRGFIKTITERDTLLGGENS